MAVQAIHFDGHTARGRPVCLTVHEGRLHVALLEVATAEGGTIACDPPGWPLAEVVWPERTRHGQRVIELKSGGSLVAQDAAAFDAWRASMGLREGWVVRAQQRWRLVALALVLLLAVVAAGYRWGLPIAARGVVAMLPATVDETLGDAGLASLDRSWLRPSRLPRAEQEAWRERFARLVDAAQPNPVARVGWQLHLRHGGGALGANALALPGGHIVITDEMLALLAGHDDTVLGVLAHEYGHVERRHGMQALAQLALVSLALSAVLSDVSSTVLAVPVLLAEADYSREAELEADAIAARMLRASGRSPAAMVVLFEKMSDQRSESAAPQRDGAHAPADPASAPEGRGLRLQLPIAFASHPQDEARIRFFRNAAR